MNFTPELIGSFAGTLLSLIASYVPGFRTWFAGLETATKQLLMLAAITIVVALAWVGNYYEIWSITTSDAAGTTHLILMWVAALVSNQSVFSVSPTTTDVKQAKIPAKDQIG